MQFSPSPRRRCNWRPRKSSPRRSPKREGSPPRAEDVRVVVRLRPPMDQKNPLVYSVDEEDCSKLLVQMEGASPTSKPCVEEFQFSRVVGPKEATAQIYSNLGLQRLIRGIAEGFQETIFAYGQTGSGKTHTILGSSELGMLQLCSHELFSSVSGEEPRRVQLVCLEIKNDEVFDLLPDGMPSEEHDVFCHRGRRYSYRRLTVWSHEEAMVLLEQAIGTREVGRSHVNSESSRSHMVVRFLVKTVKAVQGRAASGMVGSLTLVDLAGNERESGGNGTAINVSLTHLNRMLVKMQDCELDESDRRQSALNMVLYDGLKEDCGVTMIFCIHPERRFAHSARATLQMATLCRRIIQRKRVRVLEGSKLKEELAGLRCLQAQAKEEELKRAKEVVQSLKSRYEAKSRDYEVLKKNLELEFQRVETEDREKADLELRNKELVKRVSQLQLLLERQVVTPLSAAESFQDHWQELQRAYCHELRVVHEAYKKQLETLHQAMKLRVLSSEDGAGSEAALPGDRSSWAFADLGASSTDNEPCSEPSMYSGEDHETEAAKEGLMRRKGETPLSHERLLQVASPLRLKGWKQMAEDDRPVKIHTASDAALLETPISKAPLSPSLHATPKSQVSHQALSEGRGRCEYGKVPLFSPPAKGRSVARGGHDAAEALQLLLTAQPQTLAEVESIEEAASTLARLALHDNLPKHLWPQACAGGIRVMHLLPQSAQAQRDGAILLSELASKDAGAREDVASRGGILLAVSTLRWLATTSALQGKQSLLPHVSPQSSEACSGAFRLLAVMCRKGACQAYATEVGSLQVCLQCMSQQLLRSHDTAIHGCWLLMALCSKHPGNQELVRQHGGVELVMQLLEEQVKALEASNQGSGYSHVDPRAANLCAYAAGFLASVADQEGCRQALHQGGMALLVRALEMCLQSPHVVANCCIAAAHLAQHHEPSKRAARAQGITPILRALLAYRGNGPVQGSICRAIAVLTEGGVTQQAFLAARVHDGGNETGAVSMLVLALRDLPQDAALVTTASWALANLVTESPEAIDHLCGIGGPATMVALLKSSMGCHEQTMETLCRLIIAGSSCERGRQQLLASGALQALRMIRLQTAGAPQALLQALAALEDGA